ncbi:MAG: hypothetical protein ACJ735_02465 [Actinomycetes bacterium]
MDTIGLFLMGALFTIMGSALALDFRGFASWHIEQTAYIVEPLAGKHSLANLRGISKEQFRRRLPWLYLFDRVAGGVFAVVGVVLVITAL